MKDENGGLVNLTTRTKQFALRIIRLYSALPKSTEAQVLGRQLQRSGTPVGAHYREAIRARSNAEFISKLEGGMQELLVEAEIFSAEKLNPLMTEANELMSILVTCVKKEKMKAEG